MLATMRKGASGLISKALMLFLVVTFGAWGIGDMLRHSGNNAVVTVGKVKVSPAEFESRLRNIQRSADHLPPELTQSDQFRDQILQGIVQQALLLQEAAHGGIVVDTDAIARIISRTPEFRSPNNTFDRTKFDAFLRANDTNEQAFLENIRRDVTATSLLQGISLPKTLGFANLAKALAAAQAQARDAELFTVPAVAMNAIAAPDEATLTSFYGEVKEQYLTPEYRSIDYVVLSQEALEKNARAAISDNDIRDRYALEKERLGTPEKRSVSQLLYDDKAKAESAAEALKQGKSPQQVAALIVPVNAQVTSLKSIGRNGLPEKAADVAFALKQGEVSSPVQTGFGWHVFRVDAIEPEQVPSLEASREKIVKMLASEQIENALNELSGQLEDAVAAGDTISKASESLGAGAHAASLEQVDANGKNEKGVGMKADKAAPLALAKGFAQEEGENSGFFALQGGGYLAVFTREVQPQAPLPMASIRNALTTRYYAQEQAMRSSKRALEIAVALGKNDMKAVDTARVVRNKVKGVTLAQAHAATKEMQGMPPTLMRSLFDTRLGSLTPPARLANGNWVIARVTGINQSLKVSPTAGALDETQRSAMASAIYSDYLGYLVGKYPVTINKALLKPNDSE